MPDFQLHHPSCQRRSANPSFSVLATLTYNVSQTLKLVCLLDSEAPRRMCTLTHLLLIPLEVKRHAAADQGEFVCAHGLGGVGEFSQRIAAPLANTSSLSDLWRYAFASC